MNSHKEFYFVNFSKYLPTKPYVTEDLQRLYGLNELAKRVARIDEFGNKQKMRQSYKGYIQHFPGKNVILKDRFIRDLISKSQENKNKSIEDLDLELLETALAIHPESNLNLNLNVFENIEKKKELYDLKDYKSIVSIEDTKYYSKKRKYGEHQSFIDSGQKKYKKTN
ncbi:hypothetical protein PCANB_001295 [Pneumocystis canis]|nr:hypothetical protein PCK1_001293 [Pneumocystis canis]KAG5437019.1 hypothetical protein PCANB_001295 [Pneumocystis canis]